MTGSKERGGREAGRLDKRCRQAQRGLDICRMDHIFYLWCIWRDLICCLINKKATLENLMCGQLKNHNYAVTSYDDCVKSVTFAPDLVRWGC